MIDKKHIGYAPPPTLLGSGSDRQAHEFDRHLCHLAALQAYEIAGVGPNDMSLVEVHDATAFAEIQQTENLGFCKFGEGGPLVESGATTLGGRIPVSVSGGLISRGHPIGATGLAQIYELVTQLRGEAGARQVESARLGIAENGGGFNGVEEAAAVITILGRRKSGPVAPFRNSMFQGAGKPCPGARELAQQVLAGHAAEHSDVTANRHVAGFGAGLCGDAVPGGLSH